MSSLTGFGALLLNRWTTGIAGVAIASVLVWQFGPLVPGLNGPLFRAALILLLVLLWAGINGAMSWRRRRNDRALAAAITGDDDAAARRGEDATAELDALRARMRDALKRLGSRRNGRHLYERPWFVLIGPPGAGKTTMLRHSGLHFPLTRDDGDGAQGPDAIGGLGGTRLCDWWFADEAVLIDTAGRYTTQDSDTVVDRAGWLGFLDLLRRVRPRQPLNGVLVVVSLATLLEADAVERSAHARAVRRRIDEITERLGLRVPIYVLFSKADRLAGFDAYFDDLDAEGRAQVWGTTFALSDGVDGFATEFRLLLDRLDGRLVERLQQERAASRRALIVGFPLQVASLAQPLAEFLLQTFTGSRLDPAPLLRGAYMTSATQEGTPVDRITGMLSRSFGVDQKRMPSLRPVAGRSFFIGRLLREVVLGEALLVSRDPGRERRHRILRVAGFSVVGASTVAGALLLWRVDAVNRLAVQRTDESLAAYRQQLTAFRLTPVTDDDLPHVVPLLDARTRPGTLPRGATLFGLSQRDKIAQSDRLAYEHVLDTVLLPRLVWRVEKQMRMHIDDPGFLYDATRIYLMLGGAGPLDRELVRGWLLADWSVRFPGTLNAALRTRLLVHLDALLAQPLPPVTLDGALVEAARSAFSRVSLPQRVYNRIRDGGTVATASDWTPAMALGSTGTRYFARASGRPLDEGIPGLLTGAGFREVLLRRLPDTTRAVASESWVLGHAQEVPTDGPAVASLEQGVIELWAADAEHAWNALLGDLILAPPDGSDAAIQTLYVLSSPRSPMRDLLVGAAEQLTTRQPLSGKAAAPPSAPLDTAVQPFEEQFRPLRELVAMRGGGGMPLDDVLHLVDQLQGELARTRAGASGSPVPGTLAASGDPAQLLLAEAGRQPVPLSRWLEQIAATGTHDLGSAARTAASTAFADAEGPAALCRSVVSHRYPFDASAAEDASIDDFGRLFAPNGALDGFFRTQLRPYVDMAGPNWTTHAVGGVAAPVDGMALAQFQRAAAIRDAFFPAGGAEPHVRFTLTPLADTDAGAILRIGNTSVAAGGGPVLVSWPADGTDAASLSFGTTTAIRVSGPWALFRLLSAGRISNEGGTGDSTLRFASAGHAAAFSLQPGSAHEPFTRDLLHGFRCPVIR